MRSDSYIPTRLITMPKDRLRSQVTNRLHSAHSRPIHIKFPPFFRPFSSISLPPPKSSSKAQRKGSVKSRKVKGKSKLHIPPGSSSPQATPLALTYSFPSLTAKQPTSAKGAPPQDIADSCKTAAQGHHPTHSFPIHEIVAT